MVGLNPAFTGLDPAGVVDVVISGLDLARAVSRFPKKRKKGTFLAIYCYTVNAGYLIDKTLADCCDQWKALRRTRRDQEAAVQQHEHGKPCADNGSGRAINITRDLPRTLKAGCFSR
jgi:hypothetical protein